MNNYLPCLPHNRYRCQECYPEITTDSTGLLAIPSKVPETLRPAEKEDSGEKDASTAATVPIPMERYVAEIELAQRANGGAEWKKEWCECDPSVGMAPCRYCAIHHALRISLKAPSVPDATSGASATGVSSESDELWEAWESHCKERSLNPQTVSAQRHSDFTEGWKRAKRCSTSWAAQASVEGERWSIENGRWLVDPTGYSYECPRPVFAVTLKKAIDASLLRVAQAAEKKLQDLRIELAAANECHIEDHEGVTAFSRELFGRDDMGWLESLRELRRRVAQQIQGNTDSQRLDALSYEASVQMVFNYGASAWVVQLRGDRTGRGPTLRFAIDDVLRLAPSDERSPESSDAPRVSSLTSGGPRDVQGEELGK